jgi:hypothetical protein
LAGVGGALVVTGGVLLVIQLTSRESPTQVGLGCLPGGCRMALKGSF